MRSLGSTYPIILVLIQLLDPIFALSDQRLCADPKCQDIISIAKASISYQAPEAGMVSFKINSLIRVKSKSAGKDPSLWGIEVNGRQGYAPKQFLREEKILISDKNLKHIVPVEPLPGDKQINVPKANLNPSEVSNEAKTSETTTNTPPLSNEPDAEATTLNSSESTFETTTTAPLLEPINAEVINKSIKEMATPVLNKMEIIDGTAVPVIEDVVTEATKKEGQLEKREEKATTKNDKDGNMKANEKLDKPTDSNSKIKKKKSKRQADVSNEAEQATENTEKPENVATPNSAEVNTIKYVDAEIELEDVDKKLNHNTAKIVDAEIELEDVDRKVNHDAVKIVDAAIELQDADKKISDETAKLVDAVIEKEDVSIKVNNETPKLVDAVTELEDFDNKGSETKKETENNAAEIVSENLKNNKIEQQFELTETKKNEQNSAAEPDTKSLTVAQATTSDSSEIKTESIKESPSNTLNTDTSKPVEKNILLDAFEDDEDEFGDEDDDDIGDEDDIDIDDKLEPSFQSSSVELTTETPQQTTDSGFATASNMNYWEDAETDTSTIAPVPLNNPTASSLTENGGKPADELKGVEALESNSNVPADNSTTSEKIVEDVLIPEAASTPIPPLDNIVKEAQVEVTKTEMPQVPIITTTLPIFQQPNQPQVKSKEDALPTEGIDNKQQNEALTQNSEPPIHKPVYDPYQQINQQQQNQGEQHSNERFNYENPNDYYRSQAEQSQSIGRASNSMEAAETTETPITTEAQLTNETTQSSESIGTTESAIEHNTATFEEHDKNLGAGSIEMITTPSPLPLQSADGSSHDQTPNHLPIDEKRDAGLFGTILGTVNTFVNKLRKQEPLSDEHKTKNAIDGDDELQRILYPDRYAAKISAKEGVDEYCEQLSAHHCPKSKIGSAPVGSQQCNYDWAHIDMDNFVEIFVAKAFEMRELLCCLAIASSTILLFLFGYYCFCNSNREGALLSKLNLLERSLLASHKENAILKDDLQKTRNKLTSIEDNSFGSNDMVIALRKELEVNAEEKLQFEEQILSLEKELETAAEAGLELNKIVAELINNQTGQESMIMSSVEDLQLQFNEQQKTILEINANLAEKSRENSELQLMLAEQNVRFNGEIASLQQDNDELEGEKSVLQTRLTELKTEFEEDISKALEGKNVEIKRLQNEIINLNNRFEDIHTKWQTSLAKIEALEECMKTLKKGSNVNITDVINVANVRAELLDLQKQRSTLKSRLDMETEARQHAELGLQNTISEVDKLKQDFHQSEKDKLEAQTRLEVLSNYFKEKETQLQKELSLKEAIWLKQQGENTSTVDRLTAMQDEIQSLKSQNDALRAEIEAQLAAHKAQTGTLENRAHETWLAARQSERRFEEARAEAAALRRRLTELAGAAANGGEGNRNNVDGKLSVAEFNNAPSPILPPPSLMDANAGSPLLGTLPPPPHQYLPFMGPPPPPFLNLPPPPFLQSVEMRPAPLGRMMSPTSGRYSPNDRERKRRGDGYYEREYDDDYEDDDSDVEEDDYDYDDEDEQDERARNRRPRRRSGNGSDTEWHRDNYLPPPDRSYRSQSPTDSRYNYTYDDETDLSPPPSPPGRRGRDGGGGGGSRTGSYHTFSPRPATTASTNAVPERTSKKGIPNSDSDKSHNSAHHSKKGKSLV